MKKCISLLLSFLLLLTQFVPVSAATSPPEVSQIHGTTMTKTADKKYRWVDGSATYALNEYGQFEISQVAGGNWSGTTLTLNQPAANATYGTKMTSFFTEHPELAARESFTAGWNGYFRNNGTSLYDTTFPIDPLITTFRKAEVQEVASYYDGNSLLPMPSGATRTLGSIAIIKQPQGLNWFYSGHGFSANLDTKHLLYYDYSQACQVYRDRPYPQIFENVWRPVDGTMQLNGQGSSVTLREGIDYTFTPSKYYVPKDTSAAFTGLGDVTYTMNRAQMLDLYVSPKQTNYGAVPYSQKIVLGAGGVYTDVAARNCFNVIQNSAVAYNQISSTAIDVFKVAAYTTDATCSVYSPPITLPSYSWTGYSQRTDIFPLVAFVMTPLYYSPGASFSGYYASPVSQSVIGPGPYQVWNNAYPFSKYVVTDRNNNLVEVTAPRPNRQYAIHASEYVGPSDTRVASTNSGLYKFNTATLETLAADTSLVPSGRYNYSAARCLVPTSGIYSPPPAPFNLTNYTTMNRNGKNQTIPADALVTYQYKTTTTPTNGTRQDLVSLTGEGGTPLTYTSIKLSGCTSDGTIGMSTFGCPVTINGGSYKGAPALQSGSITSEYCKLNASKSYANAEVLTTPSYESCKYHSNLLFSYLQ